METRLFKFIGRITCGDKTDIVARRRVFEVSHAHGECLSLEDILRGLVTRAYTHGYFIAAADAAPCGVHSVGVAVLVVGTEDKHRLRIGEWLCAEIFSHDNSSFDLTLL